jgi:hypothetical protein
MANLVDNLYFINDISIPNLDRTGEDSTLNALIKKYQEDILIKLMGYELYSLYIAATDTGRFAAITNGAEFTFAFNGRTVKRKWKGLVNDDRESLIAYYVYVYWLKKIQTVTTGIGEMDPDTLVGDRVISVDKYVEAYNEVVKLGGDIHYVNNESYYHPCQFDIYDQSTYVYFNDQPSLYNYLVNNLSDFPEWEFTPLKRINVYGF